MRGVLLAALVLVGMAAGQEAQPPVRIAGGIMAGRIVNRVPPVYPAEARAMGIEGVVVLHAVIGKDGTARDVSVVAGVPVLADAALTAVKQWVYQPYLLNGEPSDVETTITVNFHLGTGSAPAAGAGETAGRPITGLPSGLADPAPAAHRVRISGGVMAANILSKVDPVYPAEAKSQGISGTVVMRAFIGIDGKVKTLSVVSGNEALATAAIEAVRQWTYKPYLLNGEPVDVDTTITVNFNLGGQGSLEHHSNGDAEGAEASACPSGSAGDPTPAASQAARIPGSFMASRILNHPSPKYPSLARAARIQGAVVVRALIGKDGRMEQVSVLCGPKELQRSALDAVKQWTYQPYLDVDGRPLDVETTVTVTYSFGPAAAPTGEGNSFVNGVQVVDLQSDAPELAGAKKGEPRYPKDARRAGVVGAVRVLVLIRVDGRVESAAATSGPQELRKAAEDAVRKYHYPRYVVGGVGKMVRTVETVTFSLS